MSPILLNVADIRVRSRANGPGVRSVVWVQGCSIHCPGCMNPHTHPHKVVRLFDPKILGRELANLDGIHGLTISGGEPFEQAEACADLAAAYHGSGRSVMAYSGHEFSRLSASADATVQRFLAQIDLLIAGPYVRHLACPGKLWRGSTNQTAHFLTDRLKHAVHASSGADPVVEISSDGRSMACSGFPESADLAWLRNLLQPTGVSRRCT